MTEQKNMTEKEYTNIRDNSEMVTFYKIVATDEVSIKNKGLFVTKEVLNKKIERLVKSGKYLRKNIKIQEFDRYLPKSVKQGMIKNGK